MFERGTLKIATLRGVPIRVHWTMPVGALLFSGLSFVPAFWVAFIALILVHEMGHALLVKRFGFRVLSIDITGFGGLCRWSGSATTVERSAIAWGGVLGQLVLLAIAGAWLLVMGAPSTAIGAQLISVFTTTNLMLIGLNLLPFPPLDGSQAWKLFGEKGAVGGLRTLARALFVPRRGSTRGKSKPARASRLNPASWSFPWSRRRKPEQPRPASPQSQPARGASDPGAAGSHAELAQIFRQIADDAARARRESNR